MAPLDRTALENHAVKDRLTSLKQRRAPPFRLPEYATDDADIHHLCVQHNGTCRRQQPHVGVDPDPLFMKLSSLNAMRDRDQRGAKGQEVGGKLVSPHARQVRQLATLIAPKPEPKPEPPKEKAFGRPSMVATFSGFGFGARRSTRKSRSSLRASGSRRSTSAGALPSLSSSSSAPGVEHAMGSRPRVSSKDSFHSTTPSWFAPGSHADWQAGRSDSFAFRPRRDDSLPERVEDYEQRAQILLATAFTHRGRASTAPVTRESEIKTPSQISKRMRVIRRLHDELAEASVKLLEEQSELLEEQS